MISASQDVSIIFCWDDVEMAYIDTGWRVSVAQQEGENVVLSVVASLGDEAEIRGVGTAVGISGSLFIGVWPGKRVTQATRPRVVLSLIIWPILYLLQIGRAHV